MSTAIEIQELINKIIPLDDYQHRNGFSNQQLIDNLNEIDRLKVESELISMLQRKVDMLLVETLGYMKSEKSLPTLYEVLTSRSEGMAKIITAVSIFEINSDYNMIEQAKNSFITLKDRFQLISAFYYLIRFRDQSLVKLIQHYITDPDYLISYNAKKALENSVHF